MSSLKLKKNPRLSVCSTAEFGEDMTATEVSAAHAGHDDEVLCEGGQGVSSIFDPYL